MQLTQNIPALTAIANITRGAALFNLDPQTRTREETASALLAEAHAAGLYGDNARWVAEYNLAQLGYGGGI